MSHKDIGFIKLPHINTLKKYIHFTDPVTGFTPDIIENLVIEAKIEEIPEFKKNVAIIFDEMKIKSDLVYRKSTGQLIGFTEMGDINEEFVKFEKSFDADFSEKSDREFANYVIIFMVRGILSKLIYPFGYFASMGFTAAQIYPCIWEATKILESIGFYVRAFIADGASPNRKFFKLIAGENEYFTVNLFSPDRYIYLFSDYCHLIKTTRNCFENSFGNLNTRNMHLDGKDISWRHVVDVYEWDIGLNRAAPGLRVLYKLKEEHIRLSPRLRMQVKLAVQVLSSSTAKALSLQGRHDTNGTINFIHMFDKVFDCLNVSRREEHRRQRKPELAPYTSLDDWRFKFLEEEFLENFLNRWENQANNTAGLTLEEKSKLYLSKQTMFGWKITVRSFVALTKLLLQQDGVQFVLSERFSQDPLEQHFSKQRSAGGSNDNPTLHQFGFQELALNVMGNDLIRGLRGNTGRKVNAAVKLDIHDKRKLPQKKL